MTDELELLFNTGFQVKDRYLKIKNFTGDRIGEKKDILQVIFNIDYLDSIARDQDSEYLMENLVLREKL